MKFSVSPLGLALSLLAFDVTQRPTTSTWPMFASMSPSMAPSFLVGANETMDADDGIDLSLLGTNSWARFRPGWSLTVSDQCLFEFVFQMEHDDNLPNGGTRSFGFKNQCDRDEPRTHGKDGMLWMSSREHWEELPKYVQATIGFQHLSIDWRACGEEPAGWAAPTYEFSFYRATPQYRVAVMNCTQAFPDSIDPFCEWSGQSEGTGKQFFVVPRALSNTAATVNMPLGFSFEPTRALVPHVGLRQWDRTLTPSSPDLWQELSFQMATYDGDVSMFRVKAPYRVLSHDASANMAPDKVRSFSLKYHESTIKSLPDTVSTDYDHAKGLIRLHMIGRAGLCRSDFEAAQAKAGGKPIFPDYDAVASDGGNSTDGSESSHDSAANSNSGSMLLLLFSSSVLASLVWAIGITMHL